MGGDPSSLAAASSLYANTSLTICPPGSARAAPSLTTCFPSLLPLAGEPTGAGPATRAEGSGAGR